jgi:hypothetical protein
MGSKADGQSTHLVTHPVSSGSGTVLAPDEALVSAAHGLGARQAPRYVIVWAAQGRRRRRLV